MKASIIKSFAVLACLFATTEVSAQFNISKALNAAAKGVKAATLSDADMAAYVKESVEWMDKNNPVLPEDSPYTQRLRKLTDGITEADGIPLNFKVYNVVDINAFACPDGSVRVFSSLMDIMNDDELMGIIGHEIGHVLKRHSKNAFRTQLMTGAAKDAVASAGGKAAALTESQLGSLCESFINAKYSQKQENEADDCGYDFLVLHGRNPYGMAMSFEKFMQMEEASGSKQSYVQRMFSSHPETKARIARVVKRAEQDGYQRPVAE